MFRISDRGGFIIGELLSGLLEKPNSRTFVKGRVQSSQNLDEQLS